MNPFAIKGAFQLPLEFDLGATAAFALTGAFAGIRRKYDLVGVFFLAFASGLGGGLIRDGLFLGRAPAMVITNPWYLVTVAIATGAGLIFGHRMKRFERWISLVDALGLGAYGVVGAQMTLSQGLGIPAALLIGVINAVGGGVLRDVLAREPPLIFFPGQYYALVAFVGVSCFVTLVALVGWEPTPAAVASIGLTFLLRILTIRFNLRTHAAAVDLEN